MTEKQHPITPPPELVKEWIQEADGGHDPRWQEYEQDIANRAAQWGYDQRGEVNESKLQQARDQELEACCEEMKSLPSPFGMPFGEMASNALRAARRPKPPSLKEQMLARTKAILNDPNRVLPAEVRETLELNQRALEALPDE